MISDTFALTTNLEIHTSKNLSILAGVRGYLEQWKRGKEMGMQKKGNERENGIFIREKGRKVFYFSRVPKLKCSDS